MSRSTTIGLSTVHKLCSGAGGGASDSLRRLSTHIDSLCGSVVIVAILSTRARFKSSGKPKLSGATMLQRHVPYQYGGNALHVLHVFVGGGGGGVSSIQSQDSSAYCALELEQSRDSG